MAQLRAQGAVANRDIVAELIERSFLARGVAEQKLILQQNRPLPKLEIRSHGPWETVSSRMVQEGRLDLWE